MKLVVVGPTSVVTTSLLPGVRVRIGRSAGSSVRVDDRQVSREHLAVMQGEGGHVTVEDLGSRNGTEVGGFRVESGTMVPLVAGVSFGFGAHLGWLEDVEDGPHWMDSRSFDDSVENGSRHPRVVYTVSPKAEATVETLEVDDMHLEMAQERRCIDGLRGRIVSAFQDKVVRARTLVTRRPTGAFVIAIPEGVEMPPLSRDDGTPSFDVARQTPRPSRPERTSGGGPRVVGPIAVSMRPGGPTMDLDRIACSEVTVLVLGETGTGKEVMARSIHDRSARATGRFVVVNCAAIAESLFEAELFGHERGAFTGAIASRPGYLESADGGTIFLDEIAELPRPLQAKLLRVFEDRTIQRVGAVAPRPIDVRFVAATHRDLAADVAAGRFREDLYYRLCGVVLRVPPLRERGDELRTLVADLVSRVSADPVVVSEAAMDVLARHTWPGNVRELRAVLERALLLCTGNTLEADHVVFELPEAHRRTLPDEDEAKSVPAATANPDDRRARISAALEAAHGNQTEAAAALGVSRRTLTNWLNELGLPRPRKRT
ncbi:MAG: sigma 54-interacting transcriptional regulator [Polyangiaceae bacterium]